MITPHPIADTLKRPAIGVFSKSNGFRDDPSVNVANATLKTRAGREHWSTFFTDITPLCSTPQI
jgi:hypothetical protein